MRIGRRRALLVGAAVVAGGLVADALADRFSVRRSNDPLATFAPRGGHRFDFVDTTENTNGLFFGLSLSGGGTRAAAFSYGVLTGLREQRIVWKGRETTLLDEVDLISSVSGGSFTAAYYGLFRERIFEDFEEDFLLVDVTGDLGRSLLNPVNLWRIASDRFDRIDLAAEYYDERLFDGKTIADLRAPGSRPFVVLNATNLRFGSRFSFTQEFFDFIGSDVDGYPVARAVAASSAFPFLLSPLTLRNHPRPEGFEVPTWMQVGLENPLLNARDHALARTLVPYDADKEGAPYLHLLDGGLSDNLGLRYFVDGSVRPEFAGLLQATPRVHGEPVARIEKLLVLAVNARTSSDGGIDRRASAPGLGTVGLRTATASMENYTLDTLELARDVLADLTQKQRILAEHLGADDAPPTTDTAVVEVSFQGIPEAELRARCLAMETSFTLAAEDVALLIEQGARLVRESAELQEFLAALDR